MITFTLKQDFLPPTEVLSQMARPLVTSVPRATFRLSLSNYSAVQRLRLAPQRSISTLARQFTCGSSSSTRSVSFGRGFCSSSAEGDADLYALLGVSRSATAQEIKRAYFTAAKRTHPDVDPSPGAANRFRALSSAYEVLRDPERRREYDASQSSHAAGSGGSSSSAGGQRWQQSQQWQRRQQQQPHMSEARRIFMQVWSEYGMDDVDDYIAVVNAEFSTAVSAAFSGRTAPLRAFVSEHRALVVGVAVPIAMLVRSPAAVSLALRAFTLPLLVARFLPNSSSFFGYILPIYRVQWMLVSRLWVRAIRGLERGAIAAQLIQRPRHQQPGDGSSR